MPSEVFEFELNGRATEVMAGPLASLNHVLREQLQLKATKVGCRQGGCGSDCCKCPRNGLNFCVNPAFGCGGC